MACSYCLSNCSRSFLRQNKGLCVFKDAYLKHSCRWVGRDLFLAEERRWCPWGPWVWSGASSWAALRWRWRQQRHSSLAQRTRADTSQCRVPWTNRTLWLPMHLCCSALSTDPRTLQSINSFNSDNVAHLEKQQTHRKTDSKSMEKVNEENETNKCVSKTHID